MSNEHADSDYLSTLAAEWSKLPLHPSQAVSVPDLHQAQADHDTKLGCIGRYLLKYKIGEGGLGTVYAAQDPLLSRVIAIKTLNLDVDDSKREEVNAIFLNEARSAARLSHPHIVTVFDAGMSDQKAYIAMELLKGRDLAQLRREGWQPTLAQSALILRRVADALAYAHSKGVVHCDIKPANIFMLSRTQPQVLDFGIARAAHSQNWIAAAMVTGGSPFYMAPEQFRQESVDRRTDVYALGVVLYELLTGQKPFNGANLDELSAAVLHHPPLQAHTLNPSIPQALSNIAMRAMEKNPADRYPSARDMSQELRCWLEHEHNRLNLGEFFTPAGSRKKMGVAAGILALSFIGAISWVSNRSASKGLEEPLISLAPSHKASEPSSPDATDISMISIWPKTDTHPEIIPVEEAIPVVESAASSKVPVIEPLLLSSGTPVIAPLDLPRPAPSFPRVAKLGNLQELAGSFDPVPEENLTNQPQKQGEPPQNRPPVQQPGRLISESKSGKDSRTTAEVMTTKPAASTSVSTIGMGTLRIAVSPWGQVEVNGHLVGITPPLNELNLPQGKHQIIIRNTDFAPFTSSINIISGQSILIKHSFGP